MPECSQIIQNLLYNLNEGCTDCETNSKQCSICLDVIFIFIKKTVP